MSTKTKSYKDASDEIKKLAQSVENITLTGALSGGKRRKRKSSKSASKSPKRKASPRRKSHKRKASGTKKRSGSKRRSA